MVVGSQRYALRVWTACVMARHVIGSCAMVLLPRLESTSAEGRSLHTQSVPVCSAHGTAVHGVGVPGDALWLPSVIHAGGCSV